jgi:[ribosomal protein S5]-alanine N-acetyltransferase
MEHTPATNILETTRLLLRDFELVDLDELYSLVYADPLVKDTWSRATGTPEEIKNRFAQRWIEPRSPFGLKAVVLKQTHALIGLMGFQAHEPAEGEEIYYLLSQEHPQRSVNRDPACLEVELTYALGRAYWKQGFATEMGRALIDYGFQTLGIGRIIQGVLARNPNSVNLMRRLGFRIEQGLREDLVVGVLDRVKNL